jgi:DNA-binding NarL/FixJ family response regulator
MACPDKVKAREAFRAGSSACCRQDLSPQQFVQALCQVAQGHYVLDDQVFDQEGLQAQLARAAAGRRRAAEPRLTRRELEILQYVTQGLGNKEIALALGISQPTVKNHITSMLSKLQVVDRTQMAVNALRQGWVRLQDA